MASAQSVRRVLEAIDPEELIQLAADLVRINSVWDPEAGTSERDAAEFVARWASGQGFRVATEEVAPNRPNVILSYDGWKGSKRLMFEGHTDVVTPGALANWKHDPFGAEIVGRRMYGRGTNDTKGNLATMLIAMAALKRARVSLKGEILGGVLCDEEGMMLGVQDFIRRGHADGLTGAIICEPQDGCICYSQKGAVRARYTVNGRMSHGAMPLAGLNPVPALARLIDGLVAMEREAVTACGKDPLLGWPSFTPTVVRAPAKGAAQLNVIAASAELLVDIRTITGQSHPKIIDGLRALAESVRGESIRACEEFDRTIGHKRDRSLAVEVEILTDRPTTYTDPEDPLVLAVDWATRTITNRVPVYAGVPGATDGTYLWAWKGVPIVTIGAGDREVPHQVDEWVDLDQLVETAKIYALSALAYLSGEGS
jgi:succinyl-diaminopimelate desuccinylase